MAARRALAGSILALLLGVVAMACSDLFHSTADIRTACEIDAAAAGCGAEVPLCASTSADARAQAMRVCAWLGACQSPMGRNAFGTCMFQALLAYDCTSSPNHPVQGPTRKLWTCLAAAASCSAVSGCLLPGNPECQAGDYTACIGPNGTASEGPVRVECVDGSARGENCALWAQACSSDGVSGVCGAPGGFACDPEGGAPRSCLGGTQLRCGPDGGDLALDCAATGMQACGGFPSAETLSWVACVAAQAEDAGACAPTRSATCADGAASSCPSGVSEGIDCTTLLGAPNACQAGMLVPSFDWTSPCQVTPPACTADTCGDADGGPSATLLGCVRGATVPLDCASEGLGPCQLVTTDLGTESRPACSLPTASPSANLGDP